MANFNYNVNGVVKTITADSATELFSKLNQMIIEALINEDALPDELEGKTAAEIKAFADAQYAEATRVSISAPESVTVTVSFAQSKTAATGAADHTFTFRVNGVDKSITASSATDLFSKLNQMITEALINEDELPDELEGKTAEDIMETAEKLFEEAENQAAAAAAAAATPSASPATVTVTVSLAQSKTAATGAK